MRLLLLLLPLLALVASPPVLATGQQTEGPCSPAISDVGGNVTITCVVAASPEDAAAIARKNLKVIVDRFRSVLMSQALLMPSVDRYVEDPTKAKWAIVQEDLQLTLKMVSAAIEATVVYAPSLGTEMSSNVDDLLALASMRRSFIHEFLGTDNLPTPDEAASWAGQYRDLISKLLDVLEQLDAKLPDDPDCDDLLHCI